VVTNGAGYSLGVQFNTETAVNGTTLLNKNQNYLVVIKITPVATGTETISVFVSPVIGDTEPATPEATTSVTTAALKCIEGINLRATFTGKMAGMRFSDNWADVVKPYVTKLTAPAVQDADGISATGFTAHWTPDANAVGYDVNVYLGSNLVSTTNAVGQGTASLAITGLPSGLIYNYKVISKGNGTTFSDSDPSIPAKEVISTNTDNKATIRTDLGDGTWGTVLNGSTEFPYPIAGVFPSSSANGFDLVKGYIRGVGNNGPKAEVHVNNISLDYSTYGSMLAFPTVNSVEQIEIHAKSSSDNKGFVVKEFVGNGWAVVGNYSTMNSVEGIFVISISRTVPTKFRIENSFTSGLSVYQVITRTTNPATLPAPTVGTASAITTTGFTANWTQVPNASGGYVVRVSDAALVVRKVITVTGQTTESVAVTGLITNSPYTYKVSAIGDGDIAFSDSYQSVASASVTPSNTTALDNQTVASSLTVIGRNIFSSEKGEISVFNLQGKQILNAKNVSSLYTDLVSGLYIVRFTNESGQTVNRKIAF